MYYKTSKCSAKCLKMPHTTMNIQLKGARMPHTIIKIQRGCARVITPRNAAFHHLWCSPLVLRVRWAGNRAQAPAWSPEAQTQVGWRRFEPLPHRYHQLQLLVSKRGRVRLVCQKVDKRDMNQTTETPFHIPFMSYEENMQLKIALNIVFLKR